MKLVNFGRCLAPPGARLISLLASVGLTLALLSTEAAAQYQSNVYTIEKTRKDIEAIDRELAAEDQRYAPQLNAAQGLTTEAEQLNARIRDHNRRLAIWNSTCLGTPARPGDLCSRQQQDLIAEKYALEAAVRAFNSRNNQVTADLAPRGARIQELTQHRAELIKRLNDLESAQIDLAGDCLGLSADSGEALKHKCGNIQFDNSKIDMGGCTTDACRRYDELRR